MRLELLLILEIKEIQFISLYLRFWVIILGLTACSVFTKVLQQITGEDSVGYQNT